MIVLCVCRNVANNRPKVPILDNLILDEGNGEKPHGKAVAALQAAGEQPKGSKKKCEAYNATPILREFCFYRLRKFYNLNS